MQRPEVKARIKARTKDLLYAYFKRCAIRQPFSEYRKTLENLDGKTKLSEYEIKKALQIWYDIRGD